MEDYGKFLEMVNEIKNIAVTQGGKLTKEEILSYLGDMQLSEEQLQALYQYLGAHAIEIENYEYKPDKDMLRAMTENEPVEQQEEVISGEIADSTVRNWMLGMITMIQLRKRRLFAFCRENVRYVTALSRADCTG